METVLFSNIIKSLTSVINMAYTHLLLKIYNNFYMDKFGSRSKIYSNLENTFVMKPK